jgi:hypothetical protein
MKIDNKNIKEILVAGSYISDEDIKRAEALVKAGGVSFVDALLRDAWCWSFYYWVNHHTAFDDDVPKLEGNVAR